WRLPQRQEAGHLGAQRLGWDESGRARGVCLQAGVPARAGRGSPYLLLDQLAGLWASSTQQWLRHTVPTKDANRGRWDASPFRQAIQRAAFFADAKPAVSTRKRKSDRTLICQMLAGCVTTTAACLAGKLADTDTGADFLTWFHDWVDV